MFNIGVFLNVYQTLSTKAGVPPVKQFWVTSVLIVEDRGCTLLCTCGAELVSSGSHCTRNSSCPLSWCSNTKLGQRSWTQLFLVPELYNLVSSQIMWPLQPLSLVMVLSSPDHHAENTQMGGNLSKFDFYVTTTAEEPAMFNIVSQCENLEDGNTGSSRYIHILISSSKDDPWDRLNLCSNKLTLSFSPQALSK